MDAEPLGSVLVGVVMGSRNDYAVMRSAVEVLKEFGIAHEVRVVSAHRTPDLLFEYADTAAGRGLRVIIAGAGGAAHLPGMIAAKTVVPVLGVPIPATALQGLDSLLSIVQMPKGIPVDIGDWRIRRDERGAAGCCCARDYRWSAAEEAGGVACGTAG
jgi:5-(carboxyamino)imidazole ribonucleotide mutase